MCVCVCVCVCSDQLLVKELFNGALMVFGCERVEKRRTEVEVEEEEMMRRGEERRNGREKDGEMKSEGS